MFPYFENGECVNYKARAIQGEKRYKQKTGGKQIFYNLDEVLRGTLDVVYIVEGEIDAVSLVEAGFAPHEVLSVPGGAPAEASEEPERLQRYAFVLHALSTGFSEAKKYVLALDNDPPGHALRQDLAHLLGPGKCWFVDWPQGTKDANDMLARHGAEALRDYVRNEQKPWPVEGLYRLSEIPQPPPLETWEIGFPAWEGKIRLASRCLSVATGYPGHGKTTFWQQVWMQVARRYGVKVALFSAETGIKPHVQRNLTRAYHATCDGRSPDGEWDGAEEFIEKHFVFLSRHDRRPNFAWLVQAVEAARWRHDVRAVCIDPWNRLEGEETTEDTKRCLHELADVARGCDMHVQILAHPAKPVYEARKHPPDLYAISGSQHWANAVDQGFAIWRPELFGEDGERKTEAVFIHAKARVEELGYCTSLPLDYDITRGVFATA